MAQTADGYLWFGTFNGLVRFDGLKFTVFNRANTPELPSAGIANLHADRRGWLWVSTLKGTLVLAANKWRVFGTNEGWSGNYVRTFAERRNGDLLLTTFDGKMLEFANGRLRQLPEPPGAPRSGYQGHVDEQGQWWVAQFQFIGCWDGQRWAPTLTAPIVTSAVDKIGLTAARDGGMWLFLTNALSRYRGGSEVSRLQVAEPIVGFWSMSEDSRSNLWICTTVRGICRVSPTGEVRRWTMTNGLSSESVRFVFEDRENNLWVGTSGGGLQRFKPRRFRGFEAEGTASQQVVTSVSASAAGDVWLATHDQGLLRRTVNRATKVVLTPENPIRRIVQSVLEDRLGRVWVGTYQRGLWLLDKDGTREISVGESGGDNVTTLFEDSHGRIWMAGGQAASMYDGGKFRVFGPQDGLPPGPILCFAEDSGGLVWLASQNDVFRFENNHFIPVQDETHSPIRDIVCFHADTSGAMWMGSDARGLIRWREGHLAAVGAASGLPVRSIYSIVEDRHGIWWMTSDRGVVRTSLAELQAAADHPDARVRCQILDTSDGLPGADFSTRRQPVSSRDAAGKLWFALSKGAAVIDPEEFFVNKEPPPSPIEMVSYYLPSSGGTHNRQVKLYPPFLDKVSLPPDGQRLEIQYAGLSLVAAEKVRFQVKLEPSDADWRDADKKRVAEYYDLPAGDYVFRVRAANNDGIWNQSGSSLAISLQPFVWQTWWFRLMVIVAFASVSALVTWWRLRLHHQHELAELERTRQQQAEMAHLSRVSMLGELSGSLAHELNQPLTAILSNAQAARRFLAQDHADLNEVREILNDIVQEDQRAGEVIRRLRVLFKKREPQYLPLDLNEVVQESIKLTRSDMLNQGVTARTELTPDLPGVRGDRVQLQQVILNLIMNAADAMRDTRVDERRFVVRTELDGGESVRLSLADCGHGVPAEQLEEIFQPFFTTKATGLGLGLSICRTIISTHGGKLWATPSDLGRGTTFCFTLPVRSEEE